MFFQKFLIRTLLNIEKYTTAEGKRQGNNNFEFSVGQLKTFFRLSIIRGMVKGEDEPLYSFLVNSYGRKIFSAKIARNKLKLVLQYIRFDNKAAQRQWRGTDRFEAIRELWESVMLNWSKIFSPHTKVTIHKQVSLSFSMSFYTVHA